MGIDLHSELADLVPRGASLRDIVCPPTVGIDGGQLWTGGVLRIGTTVVDGWCVGLEPDRRWTQADIAALSLDDPDDPNRWLDYYDRVYEAIDDAIDAAGVDPDRVRVVYEHMSQPRTPNQRTRRRVPLASWVPVRELNTGLAARYPGAFAVPGRLAWGNRQQRGEGGTGDWRDYYPAELWRSRPDRWLPNDHPSTARNHERAAFDIAGAAQLLLAEGVMA